MKVVTTEEAALQCLQQPAVRDLAWACFAQAIFHHSRYEPPTAAGLAPKTGASGPMFELSPERLSWLQALDEQPKPLLQHLEERPNKQRIGVYFEHLLEFFLCHDPLVQFEQRNLPVRDGGHTVGEFDCLYRDCSPEALKACGEAPLVHLEVAVKFYLALPEERGGQTERQWLGPANHDALEDKLAKLLDRQSRLAEHPAAQRCLKDAGLPQPAIHRVAVAGELFQPYGHSISAPKDCAALHHQASWVHLREIPRLQADFSSGMSLQKPQWLTPLSHDYFHANKLDWANVMEAVKQHYQTDQTADGHNKSRRQHFPIMLELQSRADSERFERCFVVPDDWPNSSVPHSRAR